MNKDTVIKHYQHSIEWVQSLTELTDKEWRSAITEGKWSIAEIIAHFVPWDEFILHDRLKECWNEQALLPQAPDALEMNQQSAERVRKEERKKRDDWAIYCCQNRITSRNEKNRTISLECILFDRSNRANVIKLLSYPSYETSH